jgi:hypothetical protein
VILWWVANAVLGLVALPIVLLEAFRIIRSLSAVTAAASGIEQSVQAVAGSVPPVMTTLSGIAGKCERLEAASAGSA